MELRKMPHLDLGKKRSMFLNLGLAISLAMTLMAFEWKSEDIKFDFLSDTEEAFDDVVEIPLTVIPPPPPPIQLHQIIIKPDEEQIKKEVVAIFELDFDDDTIIEVVEFEKITEEPIIEAPVDWASEMPVPLDGIKAYYKFISKNIKYPNQARRMGIEGKVYVQFVINKNGGVTGIKTVKGIGAGCDEEAERVIGIAPNWKSGKQGARRVSVRMILPIHFNLN
jgi:protein TonB